MKSSDAAQACVLGLAMLLAATWASAQTAGEAAAPIRVEILVGYVSARPGAIDPRAAALVQLLGRDFNLQTARVIQLHQLYLALQQLGQVDLPTGHRLSVRPEEFTPSGLRMGVEVQGMLRTHLNVRSGHQVVVGAYSYEDGRLVVRLAPTFDAPVRPPEDP